MKAEQAEYIVRVHRDSDDSLWAEVLDLPGCFASGFTLDELRESLEEAISLCREDDARGGGNGAAGRLDGPLEVGEMRVTVPA